MQNSLLKALETVLSRFLKLRFVRQTPGGRGGGGT